MSLLKVTCRSLFMHTGLFWRAIALLYRFLLQLAFAGLFSYVQVSFYIYWSLLTGHSLLCERSPASTSLLQVSFQICRSLFIHAGHFWQAISLFCERSPASTSLMQVSFCVPCQKSPTHFRKEDLQIFWFRLYHESKISWYKLIHSAIFQHLCGSNWLLVEFFLIRFFIDLASTAVGLFWSLFF